MDLLCRMGRHRRRAEPPIWNDGYWFSSCEGCGCDLVRRGGGRWREPPKGCKVVWRPRDPTHVDWNGLIATRPRRMTSPPPAREPERDRVPA